MGDWPVSRMDVITIHPWSVESIGGKFFNQGGTSFIAAASLAYPAANDALFVPFYLPKPIVIVTLFAHNGATVSGNIDMGIYDVAGVRLVSIGSTAQAGANGVQFFNITDTHVGPGHFYLAVAMNNTTGTLFRGTAGSTIRIQPMGMAKQATAFALPATATFATVTADYVPLMGLSTRAVI